MIYSLLGEILVCIGYYDSMNLSVICQLYDIKLVKYFYM